MRGLPGPSSFVVVGIPSRVIIGLLVWVFLFRKDTGSDRKQATGVIVPSDKKTIPGMAMDQGLGVECANNLRQIRMAIQMERDTGEEGLPPSLQSLHGIPASMKQCPASHRPYVYNPQTGQVYCVTPGHNRL